MYNIALNLASLEAVFLPETLRAFRSVEARLSDLQHDLEMNGTFRGRIAPYYTTG